MTLKLAWKCLSPGRLVGLSMRTLPIPPCAKYRITFQNIPSFREYPKYPPFAKSHFMHKSSGCPEAEFSHHVKVLCFLITHCKNFGFLILLCFALLYSNKASFAYAFANVSSISLLRAAFQIDFGPILRCLRTPKIVILLGTSLKSHGFHFVAIRSA